MTSQLVKILILYRDRLRSLNKANYLSCKEGKGGMKDMFCRTICCFIMKYLLRELTEDKEI